MFGEFFDLVGVFDERDGEDGRGVGDAQFLFEVGDKGGEFVDIGANFRLILFVDGFLVWAGGRRAVHALREIGIGGVGGRAIFGAAGLRREKARGERKKSGEGSGRKDKLATGVRHGSLPKSDMQAAGAGAEDGDIVEQGNEGCKREEGEKKLGKVF